MAAVECMVLKRMHSPFCYCYCMYVPSLSFLIMHTLSHAHCSSLTGARALLLLMASDNMDSPDTALATLMSTIRTTIDMRREDIFRSCTDLGVPAHGPPNLDVRINIKCPTSWQLMQYFALSNIMA
jgi:hypothetical protein